MIDAYKATLDFLKIPMIWIAVVVSTGMMNVSQIVEIVGVCL